MSIAMAKVLLVILVTVAAGLALVRERARRLHLAAETQRLHRELTRAQEMLWGQQVHVARMTNPAAVERLVQQRAATE